MRLLTTHCTGASEHNERLEGRVEVDLKEVDSIVKDHSSRLSMGKNALLDEFRRMRRPERGPGSLGQIQLEEFATDSVAQKAMSTLLANMSRKGDLQHLT